MIVLAWPRIVEIYEVGVVGLPLLVHYPQREVNTKTQTFRRQVRTIIGFQAELALSLEKGLMVAEEPARARPDLLTRTPLPERR